MSGARPPAGSLSRGLILMLAAVAILVGSIRCERGRVQRRNEPPPPDAVVFQQDVQFIDTMTRHHQRAIELWRVAERNANHEELRRFAVSAIREQQRELELMKGWRDKWFAGMPVSTTTAADTDTHSPVSVSPGPDFDLEFLALMIPHHQRAAARARAMVDRASTPELSQLAQVIYDQQNEEVSTMTGWQQAWSAKP